MPALVADVVKGSIAEELEIEIGDELVAIDGVAPRDLIDYRYAMCAEELTVEIKKKNGEIEEIELEKDFDEDLGLVFESAVFDRIKLCANNCIFCFVNQQPEGMRDTLYIKDDDYRLSYLQGTYVTLTNLTNRDKERISTYKLGPLYVSVHTTNPELRQKMLNNKQAGKILEHFEWLKENDIPVHAQVVLCPTYNDDEELRRTLNDLKAFKKILLSIAVVPVGITQFRDTELVRVDKKVAIRTIELIDEFNKSIKKQIACASDEFFLIAEKEIPPRKYYGAFSQIEDGVGSLRLIMDDFEKQKKRLPSVLKKPKKMHLITSVAASGVFQKFTQELNKIENLDLKLEVIKSNFWGKDVNVAGLITGTDILEQLTPKKEDIELLVLPAIMLKPLSESFLDDITVTDVKNALNCDVKITRDNYSVKELIDYILR